MDAVLAIHEAQIAQHGGEAGVRDVNLLESALAQPQNLAAYEENVSAAELAACYASGIIRNHPFLDGNKRVGLVLLTTFLDLHGFELDAPLAEVYAAVNGFAGNELADSEFRAWVEAHTKPSPP